jgi:transcriptional regulator GlxA family with amidase domain
VRLTAGEFTADVPATAVLACGSATLAARAADLRAAARSVGPGRAARLMAAVWRLLADVAAASEATAKADADRGDRRVALADKLMLDRIADPLDVTALAAAVGVSRVHLTRLYLAHHGIGPAARFRRLRVDRAARLLATTTLSVKEVAGVCGFTTPEHFARVFRAATGRTPGAHQRAASREHAVDRE